MAFKPSSRKAQALSISPSPKGRAHTGVGSPKTWLPDWVDSEAEGVAPGAAAPVSAAPVWRGGGVVHRTHDLLSNKEKSLPRQGAHMRTNGSPTRVGAAARRSASRGNLTGDVPGERPGEAASKLKRDLECERRRSAEEASRADLARKAEVAARKAADDSRASVAELQRQLELERRRSAEESAKATRAQRAEAAAAEAAGKARAAVAGLQRQLDQERRRADDEAASADRARKAESRALRAAEEARVLLAEIQKQLKAERQRSSAEGPGAAPAPIQAVDSEDAIVQGFARPSRTATITRPEFAEALPSLSQAYLDEIRVSAASTPCHSPRAS